MGQGNQKVRETRPNPTEHQFSAMHQQLEASKQDEPTSEQRFADWQRWAEEAEKAAKVEQDQKQWAVGLSAGLRADWEAWLEDVRQNTTEHLTPDLVNRY